MLWATTFDASAASCLTKTSICLRRTHHLLQRRRDDQLRRDASSGASPGREESGASSTGNIRGKLSLLHLLFLFAPCLAPLLAPFLAFGVNVFCWRSERGRAVLPAEEVECPLKNFSPLPPKTFLKTAADGYTCPSVSFLVFPVLVPALSLPSGPSVFTFAEPCAGSTMGVLFVLVGQWPAA